MWCAHWQPMSLQIRRPCSGTVPSHSTILVEPKGFFGVHCPRCSLWSALAVARASQREPARLANRALWVVGGTGCGRDSGSSAPRGCGDPSAGPVVPHRSRPPPPAPRSSGSGGISCARPALAAVACRWLCGPRARPRQAGGSNKVRSRGEWGRGAGGRSGREPAWQWERWPRCCVPGPTAVTRADARGTLSLTCCSPGSREPVFWPRFARSGFATPRVF